MSGQRDTCYGAYLRQQVTNPFVGVIREGALSTPTVQRQLCSHRSPTMCPHPTRLLGSSRYHALAFRAEKRIGAGGVVSGHYTYSKNMTDVETLTDWLEGGSSAPVAGYQTNNLEEEWALSSFDFGTAWWSTSLSTSRSARDAGSVPARRGSQQAD